MSNLEIDAPLVDGGLMPYHGRGESCREAIEKMIGNDFGAPPRSVVFTVLTQSGKTVKLVVPYAHNGEAIVTIDGDRV